MQPSILPRQQDLQGMVLRTMTGLVTAGCIRIGDRLGIYGAMAHRGPLTAADVASSIHLNERFVLEWLCQQASAGILIYHEPDRFELDDAAARLFGDETSPTFAGGQFRMAPEIMELFVQAEEAFKTGVGRTFSEATASRITEMPRAPLQVWARAMFVPEALPRIDGVIDALRAGGVVCDFGCGAGAAPLAIAEAFPAARVFGYDNWDAVLEFADTSRRGANLQNLSFHNPDREPLPDSPTFDLVLTMDVLHDMARPDNIARAIRRAIKPNGAWFIVDFDSSPDFATNLLKPNAAVLYGLSVGICLQSSASTPDGMALGTAGLPEEKMRRLVGDAGFTRFERLSGIENPANAYYVARP